MRKKWKRSLLFLLGLFVAACGSGDDPRGGASAEGNLDVPGSAVKAHVQWLGYVDVKKDSSNPTNINQEALGAWNLMSDKMGFGQIPFDKSAVAISKDAPVNLVRKLMPDYRQEKDFPQQTMERIVYRAESDSVVTKAFISEGLATTFCVLSSPTSNYEKEFWELFAQEVKDTCKGQEETEWEHFLGAQRRRIFHQQNCDVNRIATQVFAQQKLRLQSPGRSTIPLLLLGTFVPLKNQGCAETNEEKSNAYPDFDRLFAAKAGVPETSLNLYLFAGMLETDVALRSPRDAGFRDYLSFLTTIHSFFRNKKAPWQAVSVPGIPGALTNGVAAENASVPVPYEAFFESAYTDANAYNKSTAVRQKSDTLFNELAEKELQWETKVYVVSPQGKKQALTVKLHTYFGDSTASLRSSVFIRAYKQSLIYGDVVFYLGHNRSLCFDKTTPSTEEFPPAKYRIVVANGCKTTGNAGDYVFPALLPDTDIVTNGVSSRALGNEAAEFFTSLFSVTPLQWKIILERMAAKTHDPLRNVTLATSLKGDRSKPPVNTLSFEP